MSDPASTAVEPTDNGDLSGRQLGDYRLMHGSAGGGMADVYLAEQLSLRRQVALKILKSDLARDQNYIRRFHQEAQAAASLVHANIVQIHEVGDYEGIHFIAQEYVAGMNLKEWLTRRGMPDLKLALLIMRQVAAALHKAAEQGIVHRDIKPENIMLSQSGEVKVADFGLARMTGNGAGMNITQVGLTMGTPLYMSPEQVEGKPLDPRSDLYSFGVTCYHMLAGEPPFRGETALGVAVQHLNVQPERLETRRPDLPAGMCRVIHKMLAKNPAERFATARDLLKDLRALQPNGDDDAWPEELSNWSTTELTTLNSRYEATQRLAGLMKTQAMVLQRPSRVNYWIAGMAIAFLIGVGVAYARREPFLLNTPSAKVSTIERKANAESQYILAMLMDTEEAWQAVPRYFPNDKLYTPRAKQQLARLYLKQDDYARAMGLFDEFAQMDNVEQQYRAFGLAGRAIVYSLQSKYEQSAHALAELWPLKDQLRQAPDLGEMVAQVFRKNRLATDQRAADDREQWFQKNFPADAHVTPPGT